MDVQECDCLIFIGGEYPEKKWMPQDWQPALVIAADSGYYAAKELGYRVDHAIGDFDSVNLDLVTQEIKKENIHRFPRAKALSDTDLAVDLAKELGAKNIAMIGGGGKRADHFLAITKIFNNELTPQVWMTQNEKIIPIVSQAKMRLAVGTTVSFFALQQPPEYVLTKGLTWELDNVAWREGAFSLSNVVNEEILEIHIKDGRLLAIFPYILDNNH